MASMDFSFVDMGQGDCTLIKAPNNHVYIVDCGSTGQLTDTIFDSAKAKVRAAANGNRVTVILTHPDRDHYNKIISLLYEGIRGNNVRIDKLYFSLRLANDSPLGNYNQSRMGGNLGFLGNPDIYEVTINGTNRALREWTNADGYYEPTVTPIDAAGYVVADGVTGPDNTPWSIKIVAGNVDSGTQNWTEISNTASLVTSATIGTDRVVLTGDATLPTLDYVRKNQTARVANPSILQIPHHGSLSSLPTDAIISAFNPLTGLISVGLLNDSYHLPRKAVIDRWLTASRLLGKPQDADYWVQYNDTYNDNAKLNSILTGPWSKYEVLYNNSQSFFWLKDPADAQRSGTGFYGFTNNFFFLYRKVLKKEIIETGIFDGELNVRFDGS